MELASTKAGQRRVEMDRARAARFALTVSDPKPVTEVASLWRTAAQSATIGMFVILLIVALEPCAAGPVADRVGLRGDDDAGAVVGTG